MKTGANELTLANGRFLLDTNIVIGLPDGEAGLLSAFGQAGMAFVPTVVPGEFYYGAAKSGRPSENAARVDQFVAHASVLPVDLAVAREYGLVKQERRRMGRPVPENDIWIAAAARRFGPIVVTRDRHFVEVDGLATTDWADGSSSSS